MSSLSDRALHQILQQRAIAQPDRRAYTYLADGADSTADAEHITYGQLDQRARAIATAITGAAAPGDRALLLYPSGLEFIAAFFGCLYAGIVAVPANPPRHRRLVSRLDAIRADARPSLTLTTTPLLQRLVGDVGDTTLAASTVVPTDQLTPARSTSARVDAASPETLALLQYTSGSTASPKGVIVTHHNLTYNSEFVRYSCELSEQSVSVSWLPIYHDMGLIEGVLQPLYTGFTGVLMSPFNFIQKPARWLAAITAYRGTHAGAPNFAFDRCVDRITDQQLSTFDLSTLDSLYNAAEPIRHSTMERFVQRFARCGLAPRAMYSCYGLAEATLMVSGERSPRTVTVSSTRLEQGVAEDVSFPTDRPTRLVSCGRARLDTSIRIVDDDRRIECAENVVGEIWVGGPAVAQGYWQRPEESAAVFGTELHGQPGRYLRTGDLGFMRDGDLFVTGRSKDLIIVRGRNHYPQDIESIVQQAHPALRADGGAAFSVESDEGERLVVVHEIDRLAMRGAVLNDIASTVAQAVTELTELRLSQLVLIRPASLPKTSSGKVQRRLCRSLYLKGTLDEVHRWPA